MRLLIVANGFPPTAYGGVEIYSHQIARGLQSRGHDVLVLCREADATRPDYSLMHDVVDDIPVVRLVNDYKRPGDFRTSFSDARVDALYEQILDEFQPERVHYNHWIALSAGMPALTRRRGIPAVLSLHDYWPICHRINLITSSGEICPGGSPRDCYRCVFEPPGRLGRRYRLAQMLKPFLPLDVRLRVNRWLGLQIDFGLITRAAPSDFAARRQSFTRAFQQVDQILTPSWFVRDIYQANGFPMQQAQVVPLGVEIKPQPHRPAPGLLRLGFVGSVLQIKGIDRLVKAFRNTPGENIHLDIYGREDLYPLFNRHVRILAGDDARIAFNGPFQPDQRAEIFARMDALVIPSVVHETFSFVAREALLAGVPVIAARMGALPEIIHDGVNGFLYPAEDIDALSAIFTRVVSHPEILDELHLPGPVEILDPAGHLDRLEQIYQTVSLSAC